MIGAGYEDGNDASRCAAIRWFKSDGSDAV
jgi:hypothetical protein